MLQFEKDSQQTIPTSEIKVIGLGGAGANIIDRVILNGIKGPEILSVNADIRTLQASSAKEKIQLGKHVTKGLGCGGDPELGLKAAQECEQELKEAIKGYKIIFLCVGLGGGTGSGAAPLIARLAREEGAFTVVFATMPFAFEGSRRRIQAETSLNELAVMANALVTFDNGRMGELVLASQGIHEAFEATNHLISESIQSISRIALFPGIVHIGLDDLVTSLSSNRSRCLFGSGKSSKEDRVMEALKEALNSPLLDKGKLLKSAETVLVHICGGHSLTMFEADLMMNELAKNLHSDAQIFFGVSIDESMDNEFSVTIISSLPEEEVMVIDEEEEVKKTDAAPVAAETPLESNDEEELERGEDESSEEVVEGDMSAPEEEIAEEVSSALDSEPLVDAVPTDAIEPENVVEAEIPQEVDFSDEERMAEEELPSEEVVQKAPPQEHEDLQSISEPAAADTVEEEEITSEEEPIRALKKPIFEPFPTSLEEESEASADIEEEEEISEPELSEPVRDVIEPEISVPVEPELIQEEKEDATQPNSVRRRFAHLFGKKEESVKAKEKKNLLNDSESPSDLFANQEVSAVESKASPKWLDLLGKVSAPTETSSRDSSEEVTGGSSSDELLEGVTVISETQATDSLKRVEAVDKEEVTKTVIDLNDPDSIPLSDLSEPATMEEVKPLPVESREDGGMPSREELLSPRKGMKTKSQKAKTIEPEGDLFGGAFGQGELLLDGQPKGKFEGESPNIFEGEDLDVPTFLRNKK